MLNTLDRFKRKQKEYMKYKDGKVVPVKVEEPKRFEDFSGNGAEQDDFNLKDAVMETIDVSGKKVREYVTFRNLQIIGAILVMIFFAFTARDIYKTFTTPVSSQTTNAVTKNVTTTAKPKVQTTTTKVTPSVPAQKGVYNTSPVNQAVQSVLGTSTPSDSTVTSNTQPTASPLRQAIDLANGANNTIATETNSEIEHLNAYLNNEMNISTVTQSVSDSLSSKQQSLSSLVANKNIFDQEGIDDYYQTTVDRLNNAIAFSNSVLASLNNEADQSQYAREIDAFISKEQTLKQTQNNEFLSLLKKKGIKYTVDNQNQEISFSVN